jgi:hypothetical protein
MAFTVTAPLVLAKDQGGQTHHVYQGGVIHYLSDEQREHFLAEHLVEETDEADDAPDDGDDKPSKAAKKDELVAWVAERVAKDDGSDYTVEELEAMKVPELRAIVDSVE